MLRTLESSELATRLSSKDVTISHELLALGGPKRLIYSNLTYTKVSQNCHEVHIVYLLII